MVLTPMEIYNKEFRKSFRGYKEEDVDVFMDKVLADYEKLYKENLDLQEGLENYRVNIEKYKKMEETLHNSIIVAQQTAEEVKKNAGERADLLISQAEFRAREIIAGAEVKVETVQKTYEDLVQKTRIFKVKIKSFLQAQLELLEEDINEHKAKIDDCEEGL